MPLLGLRGGGEYLSSYSDFSGACKNNKKCYNSDMVYHVDRKAFTLAEVLITLGIIGIVAALVMPMVLDNINERKYTAARLKALKTIGEAVRNITVTEGIGNASNAEDFVENHLRKQIQIVKTCKNNDLRSCGIETNSNAITTLTVPHTNITMPKKIGDMAAGMSEGEVTDGNSTSYGFILSNGYSVNLFYNPNCMSYSKNSEYMGQDSVCVNAIYDMNGLSRPNEVGKDIGFVTVISPDEHVVAYAPDVYKENAERDTFYNAPQSCKNQDKDLFVPNRDEMISMYYNSNLIGITSGHYWSSTEASAMYSWLQRFGNGYSGKGPKSASNNVRCIRR